MKEFKTKIHYQLILVLFALIISMFPAKAYADELQPAEDYVETKEETPVTEAEWGLDKTELTVNIAMDSYGELHLTDLGDDMDLKNDFIIESSDPSVVAAEAADSCIALYYQHQGTAVISVTDKYGKSECCTVIVSAPDWSLMDNELKMIINQENNYIELIGGPFWNFKNDFTITNSNPEVVSIIDINDTLIELQSESCGTSVITLSDDYGRTASVNVTVAYAEWHLAQTSVYLVPRYNMNYSINITSLFYDNEFTVESSDPEMIAATMDDSGCRVNLEVLKPGSAVITVTDKAGKQESCLVEVPAVEWHLSDNKQTGEWNSVIWLQLKGDTDNLDLYDFTIKSSDEKIVSSGGLCGDSLLLYTHEVGKATITMTDPFGRTETCDVTVTYGAFELERKSIVFNTMYEEQYDTHAFNHCMMAYPEGYVDSIAKTVSTSNKNVATASVDEYGDGVFIKPTGVGTAVLTVTDQYGQKTTVEVTVTRQYADEMKYLGELNSSSVGFIEYDDTYLPCICYTTANVYTTINNKKYYAKAEPDGYYDEYTYAFHNLPKLNAGKKITVYFQKGLAIYKETTEVLPADGRDATVTAKDQTYTGKALKSQITVKHHGKVLKEGTHYTVSYTNNKNIGTATATIKFKGNYRFTKKASFKILPKGTSLTSLKKAKKAFTVKWKKQAEKMPTSQITGYQIQYSTNAKFASGNKTVTVKGVKNVSRKIKGLKSKKKYYVRIRTYKTVNGKNYYSSWSAVKSVTTK